MDAIFQSGIHQTGHSAVRDNLFCLQLLFAQILASFPLDEAVVVRGNLTEVEREVALLPVGTPTIYHPFQEFGIIAITRHIVFSLIPNGTAKGIADQWFQLTVIEGRRTALMQFSHHFIGDGKLYVGIVFRPFLHNGILF